MRKPNFTAINRHLRNEKAKKRPTITKVQTNKVLIEAHRHPGIFISKGVNDNLLTRMLEGGQNLYDDRKITVTDRETVEYYTWNPFKSKLAAGILSGLDKLFMTTKSKVLYIGAKGSSNLCHISDIIGTEGFLFALSKDIKNDIIYASHQRSNIFPIIANPNDPLSYSIQTPMVDLIICDISSNTVPDMISENAKHFLKDGGHLIMFIDADKIDKMMAAESIYVLQTDTLKKHNFTPISKTYLNPYYKSSALLTFEYRSTKPRK